MILQETNTNEVQRILNKAHPELAVREVQPTQHGRSNWVFEVDAEWIFCFPRREDVPFENIVNLLQHAEPRIKLHIPSIECPSGKRAWNLGRELVVFEPFHDGEGYEWHGRTDRMIDGR